MSRAFVKEDIDPPERSTRARTASGLPPGAANYITARGATLLRDKLESLRGNAIANEAQIRQLQELLGSVTVVNPVAEPETIAFGARVTVRDSAGHARSYQIVGVDELDLYSDAVSWISPIGKTLLAAEVGDRVTLHEERVEIVGAMYPTE